MSKLPENVFNKFIADVGPDPKFQTGAMATAPHPAVTLMLDRDSGERLPTLCE